MLTHCRVHCKCRIIPSFLRRRRVAMLFIVSKVMAVIKNVFHTYTLLLLCKILLKKAVVGIFLPHLI